MRELTLGDAQVPQGTAKLGRGRGHGATLPGPVRMALCRHYAYTYLTDVRQVVAPCRRAFSLRRAVVVRRLLLCAAESEWRCNLRGWSRRLPAYHRCDRLDLR